ncbi:MAG: hypothetical protein JXL84_22090 [Deltaproteobacteria bacterium]|nr:hypothetical protein [Deltaproteobacteria bacterium]
MNFLLIPLLGLMPLIANAKEAPPAVPVDRNIIQGIELLYQGETDRAEEIFRGLVSTRPRDPAGYFYLAMVSWSRLSSGFWGRESVEEYTERIDLAISKARAVIGEGVPNSYTYFYLGGALGFKGRFNLMEHNWLSSFFLALDAIDALKTCQRMDPSNKDVLLGLGIFDYYTAKLSGVLKFLTYLLLHKGDSEEGLRKLRVAAEEATYSSIEAKSVLLHIYLFMEGNHHKALPLAKELTMRFERSPRYKYLKALAYSRLRMDSRTTELLDSMRSLAKEQTSETQAAIWIRQALYLEATQALDDECYDDARSSLDRILSMPDPIHDPSMVAWPLLKKGMSYDLEGEREKALVLYRRVMNMENGAGAQFLAEKYADTPIEKKDPFIGY